MLRRDLKCEMDRTMQVQGKILAVDDDFPNDITIVEELLADNYDLKKRLRQVNKRVLEEYVP
jgi:hypothetical protein